MGSIPHGSTINLQGQAVSVPAPKFDASSIVPFQIGSPDDGATNLVHFPRRDADEPQSVSHGSHQVASLTQLQLSNPNLFLSQALANQTVLSTTVLSVTSDSSAPQATPDAGGGTDNIAFLVGKGAPRAGGPNASSARVTAIFWIERVRDHNGHEFNQLQYTQRVLLNFKGLSWPHVTVGTLVTQTLPTTYVVRAGDPLSSIAARFYGAGTKLFWTMIYEETETSSERIQM